MSREDDIKKLIAEHYRHLQKLREQKAKFGLHIPTHILTEIEDRETELEKLQSELTESTDSSNVIVQSSSMLVSDTATPNVNINSQKFIEAPTQSIYQSRPYAPGWIILLVIPFAWLIGHSVSLAFVGLDLSPFIIFGTMGGVISTLLITWFGLSITSLASRIYATQLARISVLFLLGGLVSGFTGLFIWLFGCAFDPASYGQQIVGCNNTSKIIWKLGTGIGSLAGLVGANIFMLTELGATGIKKHLSK